LALSREQEYRADEIGVAICGHPDWLIAALRTLNRQTAHRSPQDKPLGRIAPFALFVGADALEGQSSLFSSHPPIALRIARLERHPLGRY
jgi:heat shock protein HtpX